MGHREGIARILTENSCKLFKGRACHPEHRQIGLMMKYLRQALLPNYFLSKDDGTVLEVVDALHHVVAGQIHRAVYQRCFEKDGTSDSRAVVQEKADAMLDKLPVLQEMLYEDIVETYNSDPAATSYDEVILTYPGLLALSVYRAAHEMTKLNIPLLPRMMTEYAHYVTGIDLHPGAQIGRGIMIDHGTGIVVGETAVVGNHVKIYQGVTLGALYFPRDESGEMVREVKRHPTVEDYVVLYANSTVLGGETVIGHHSVVGSNAWITESIPPYSKVLYQTENIVKTKSM